jgi:regulator of sigma E protease
MAGFTAGDEIVAVDGEATASWQEVNWQLFNFIGEDVRFPVVLQSDSGSQRQVFVEVTAWLSDSDEPDPMAGLGIEPRRMRIAAQLGELSADGRAKAAGLQPGDIILRVNENDIADWYEWVEQVRAAPEQPLQLSVQRGQQQLALTLVPAEKITDRGERIGFVGAGVQVPEIPPSWLRTSQAGVLHGLQLGVEKTASLIGFTLDSLWKMIQGDVSVKNLSGPITIAKVAGASASGGLESFVGFLALLSVSLGVLNLLPVPMLDGGHILFYSAEMLTGKPLPEKVQIAAIKVGMLLLLSLMMVAFYNDISRL